jgi:hypothetical protein
MSVGDTNEKLVAKERIENTRKKNHAKNAERSWHNGQ